MTVVSLQSERDKRNGPEANCISTDADGIPVFKFTFNYRCNGRRYAFDTWARSWPDAEAHLAAIQSDAWLEGATVAEY